MPSARSLAMIARSSSMLVSSSRRREDNSTKKHNTPAVRPPLATPLSLTTCLCHDVVLGGFYLSNTCMIARMSQAFCPSLLHTGLEQYS